MERTRNETALGTLSWIGLGAYVALADRYVEESLTHAFRRGLDNPRYRPVLLGGMVITCLHLLDALPRPVDPYYAVEKLGKTVLKAL